MKDSVISLIAGGIAGLTETCITWPIENMKTQLQLQVSSNTIKTSTRPQFTNLMKL